MSSTRGDIIEMIKSSPFARSHYSVDIPLNTFHKSMMMYISDKKYENGFVLEDIFSGVPEFQRDNNKWSESMQIKFVENIIMGCKSTIMLYEVPPKGDLSSYCDCMILDGLQRITAIHRFIRGEIKAFEHTFLELLELRVLTNVRCRIKVNIYTFATEREVIEFYIAMNESITHSSEDIDKAKAYLIT